MRIVVLDSPNPAAVGHPTRGGHYSTHEIDDAAGVLREGVRLRADLNRPALEDECQAAWRGNRRRRGRRHGGQQEGEKLSAIYHRRGNSISSDGSRCQSRRSLRRQYSSTCRSMQFIEGPAAQHSTFGGSP